MRKLLLSFIILTSPLIGMAQYNWEIGGHGGAANYLGELGGKGSTRRDFVADMKVKKTEFTGGGFVRYKFSSLFSAQVTYSIVQIDGEDAASTNPGRVGRNLSFRDNIQELSFTAQIYFLDIPDLGHTYRYKNNFKMYAFGGVAPFYYNPKTYYDGTWVALRPLQTEGVNYGKFNVAIPAGVGFLFTISKQHRIGWEFNWRTTFTDYLDDVSGNYVDPKTQSALAAALANRRGELGHPDGIPGVLPADVNYGYHSDTDGSPSDASHTGGSKRGDPAHKDSYLTTSVYYSYVLRGKSTLYKSKYGSIFNKGNKKRKKIHAHF